MSLYRLTKLWKVANELVLDERKRVFPYRSVVHVTCHRYTGFGIVDSCADVPPDKIAVLLENGNVWFYDTEDCAPNENKAVRPEWIKRKFKSWAAQKAASTRRAIQRGESH